MARSIYIVSSLHVFKIKIDSSDDSSGDSSGSLFFEQLVRFSEVNVKKRKVEESS